MLQKLRYFGGSILLTVLAVLVSHLAQGPKAVFTIVVLIAIELSFSFDNAIINAKILARMSRIWQQAFLTIGMLIAIVGMRFIFPILIVMITAGLPWHQVIDDAFNHPDVYASHLEAAHHIISAFGGGFLLTLTLFFFFDNGRQDIWIRRFEKPFQRLGGRIWIPPVTAGLIVVIVAYFTGNHMADTLRAGLFGVILYTLISVMIDALNKATGQDVDQSAKPKSSLKMYVGWSALVAFMYLEVLDASFSFDGVIGAFAITNNILLIALGLGVGAIWVRSLTIYMVRKGTLSTYKYLEHGAHYAILALTIALFSSLFIGVPEVITGTVGIGVILASFVSSRKVLNS